MLSIAPKVESAEVRPMAAMRGRLGSTMAPAAWPVGVSLLAQAVEACQHGKTGAIDGDWFARLPKLSRTRKAYGN